jgi:hypothetical protein
MHGEDEISCEEYFCSNHLAITETKDGRAMLLCPACYEFAQKEGLLDEEE